MLTVKSTINIAGQTVPNIIPAVQGDTGRTIEFTIADFTIPAGATATYYIQKPSGEAVYNAATISGNSVICNLTAQSLAEPLDNFGQVRIFSGDEVVTSFDFILHVEPFRGIEAIESTTEMNIFDEAVEQAIEYISSAVDPTLTVAGKAADAKATGDAIATLKSTAVTTKYQDATAIPNNTDYNTLTTPGNYYCSSSASARTMTNIPPITTAHRLIVLTRNNSSTITQILIASNSNSTMYIRNNAATWHKVAVDIDTLMTDSSFRSSASTAPASDFNDLEPGTIYTLGSAAVEVMANAPKGSLNVAGADQTYGVPSGTVVTFRGGGNGEVQIFFAQSGSPYSQPIINIRHKYYSNSTWQWTPWAQLATLYGVLRATNTFIQESRIQAGTADFTDMDDAPNNTIYQIDLDAVSMAHNPISGRSCVLITFSPSFISNHGSMQLCAGLETGDAYTPQMYYRYGYRQSSTEFRWTTWIKIAGETDQEFLEIKGRLANSTDLNTITNNSIYLMGADGGYVNNPISGYAGFMTVKTKDTISMQTVERLNGERHTRYTTNGGTSWSNWT